MINQELSIDDFTDGCTGISSTECAYNTTQHNTALTNVDQFTKKNYVSFNPFEPEARVNSIHELSPYLKENTTLHHYKDQLVKAV
jgi:hypothetical protein